MNQSALKTFAQEARNKLRQLIGARLDYVLTVDTAELRQQTAQVIELRTALKTEGRDPLIERVAYTWFNRLAALRFMDANGYHPFGARVITPATTNETLPELLQQARAGALDADFKAQIANLKTFDDLLAGRIPVDHPEAQVFKLLLVAACNYYHRLMPFLFEKLGDATELLLPEDLLTEHSIIADFRENLTDEDCANEEVLGWFYQYYISQKKVEVDARKKVVPKEDIPAVTQLFTPHWIVRYLVENSLGRLWMLNRPHSKLREKMPYYIEGEAETDFLKISKPEDMRLLDPAGGSGHMLTYAFDLLYAIYEEEGYDAPEIPGLILRHNLYGVDICDRAMALAAFALCMKARAKDNRFFRRAVQPNLISLQEIHFDDGELASYFKALNTQPSVFNPQLTQLLHQFDAAKNFGALIKPCLSETDIVAIREKLSALNSQLSNPDLTVALTHSKVLRVLTQAEFLCQRYHVVVANPPYMGSKQMNAELKNWCEDQDEGASGDLFAMFISRLGNLAINSGVQGMITMHSWMFISEYEELREELMKSKTVLSLLHLGPHAFDQITGERVQTAAFLFSNQPPGGASGRYARLVSGKSEAEKERQFHDPASWFTVRQSDFFKLPWKPLIYWISEKMRAAFSVGTPLGEIAKPKKGFDTGSSSEAYFRLWWEPGNSSIFRDGRKLEVSRWVEVNKGGEFRRWYGNRQHLVTFAGSGTSLYGIQGANIRNKKDYFKPGLTYTIVSSSQLSFRESFNSAVFYQSGGTCVAEDEEKRFGLLGLLNTELADRFVSGICPTTNSTVDDVAKFPVIIPKDWPAAGKPFVMEMVQIARADWDNFETSWDFRELPLIRPGLKGATLAASWQNWKMHCDNAIQQMRELEKENNRLFIAAYDLQDELKPEVPEEQISLAHAEARKDITALLSYTVGCMVGRYSLDQPGLILADAGATVQDYLAKIPKPTFAPDDDGILPVLDGDWFQDDVVGRLREFLRVTFGEENLTENLTFIENSLGKLDAKTGKAKPTDLRTYFVREFYKEHLKTYKKRPIYWMFSSPEGSFQALIYLHRYTRDTVNLLLNDYVREFIGKLEEKHRQLTAVTLNESARPGDRTKAAKELGKIAKMLKEIQTWERDILLPLAQQRIELDLDDGVKVNYLKFRGAVVNIPGLEKGEEE